MSILAQLLSDTSPGKYTSQLVGEKLQRSLIIIIIISIIIIIIVNAETMVTMGVLFARHVVFY